MISNNIQFMLELYIDPLFLETSTLEIIWGFNITTE